MIGWFKGIFFDPAIAALSDADFAHMCDQAKARRGDAIWVLPVLAGVVGVCAWLAVAMVLIGIVNGAGALGAGGGAQQVLTVAPASGGLGLGGGGSGTVVLSGGRDPVAMQWWGTNAIVAIMLGSALAALVYYVLLLRSVQTLVVRAGCPYCGFSLVGLLIDATNAVSCPECGQRVFLHEHRIKREDVEVARATPGPGPRGAYRDLASARDALG